MSGTKELLLLHGPNLNLLGTREPHIYGTTTLDDINRMCTEYAAKYNVGVRAVQSNHEGVMIDALQDAKKWASGIVINAASYTHTSLALRDTLLAVELPAIEVHLSNVHSREEYRHKTIIGGACVGVICGFRWRSYLLAVEAMLGHLGILD